MSKLKSETSSLVRISNKHINLAKKIKKISGVPVGKTFEAAIEYYDYASKNVKGVVVSKQLNN